MVIVEKHIASLLFEHECVILPEFGGFIANYKSAKIDVSTGVASPPSKGISFNKFLNHNDGLLINDISKKCGINYSESQNLVNEYIVHLKNEIKENRRFEVKGVGLFFDKEGIINFKPESGNFLASAFGFEPVSFSKLTKLEEKKLVEPKPITRKSETTIKENRTVVPVIQEEKNKSRIPKYLLTSLSILILFYVAWIPLKTDVFKSGKIELSDLNPFNFNKCAATYSFIEYGDNSFDFEEPSVDLNASMAIADRDFTVVDKYEFAAKNEVDSTYLDNKVEKSEWSKTYYVVAGCFKEESNAKKLIRTLSEEGYNALLIDQNKGLYRVAFEKFESRREAKKLFKSIKNEGKSAWILKKLR